MRTAVYQFVFVCALVVAAGNALVYRHYEHDKDVQEDVVSLKMGETLMLGFQSQWHKTGYHWLFNKNHSNAQYVKESGTGRSREGKDNFVFNFTGTKQTSAFGDRLIFECAPIWSYPEGIMNSVYINISVTP